MNPAHFRRPLHIQSEPPARLLLCPRPAHVNPIKQAPRSFSTPPRPIDLNRLEHRLSQHNFLDNIKILPCDELDSLTATLKEAHKLAQSAQASSSVVSLLETRQREIAALIKSKLNIISV